MTSLNFKKAKHNIVPAIFCSLLIHLIVGVFLIFYLSTDSISSPKLNGINLLWVSLDAENDATAIRENRFAQQSSAMGRNLQNTVSVQKTAATILKRTGNKEPLINDEYGAELKEKSFNIRNVIADGNTDKVSNVNTIIAYPLYKENAPPVYPETARARGYEGIVLVFAEILSDGRVGKIKIGKSSGYAILDQSAIQAVKPWKFEPAKKSGTPFAAWVELPIKFILHNNSQS